MIHFKPSALGVPLGIDSAHRPHIHESWLRSEVLRIARCSTSHHLFEVGRHMFVSRLQRFNVPNTLISLIQQFDPYLQAEARSEHHARHGRSQVSSNAWIVLPHHPAWRSGRLRHIIASLVGEPWWQQFLQYEWPHSSFGCIQVSWKLLRSTISNQLGRR